MMKETWILLLNDMRSPKSEFLQPVAQASSREELTNFLMRERVTGYPDATATNIWHKVHRRGGPLEWFNPPTGHPNDHLQILPSEEEILARFRAQKAIIPSVGPCTIHDDCRENEELGRACLGDRPPDTARVDDIK